MMLAVFKTELVGINAIDEPSALPMPSATSSDPAFEIATAAPEPTSTPEPPTPTEAAEEIGNAMLPPDLPVTDIPPPNPTASMVSTPEEEEDDDKGECKLLGPFALLIQGALGALALLSLVYKRWRETPRRPIKIWSFDVSKQVLGSVFIHILNLLMSMLSSGQFDVATAVKPGSPASLFRRDDAFVQDDTVSDKPNPCSFYLLNLAIDVRTLYATYAPAS